MGYTSPGVTIKNQYEPLISPVVGGDRQLAVVGKVLTNNLNLYPTRVYEARKGTANPDLTSFEIWENRLGSIADASRITRVWQGATQFTGASADYRSSAITYVGPVDTYTYTGVLAVAPTTAVRYTVPAATTFSVTVSTGVTLPIQTGISVPTGWQIWVDGTSRVAVGASLDGAVITALTLDTAANGDVTIQVDSSGAGFTGGTSYDFQLYAPSTQYESLVVDDGTGTAYSPTVSLGVTNVLTTADLEVSVDWTAVATPPTTYYVNVADSTVDYTYLVDDTTVSDEISINIYWGTLGTTPVDGSSYLFETLVEVPGERGIYTSEDEVQKAFGPIIDPTDPDFTDTTKINELSLAAHLVFREGVSSVILVPYDGSSITSTQALEWLASDNDANIIVGIDANQPTAGGVTLTDQIITHVEDASSELVQKFRLGIINPAVSTTFTTAYNAYTTMAALVDSIRIVLVGPSELSFNVPVPVTGEYKVFKPSGAYGAVIYGAMMCRPEYDVATAMLRKESRSLAKIRQDQLWDDRKMDMVAAKGITLFAKTTGEYKVRDDITTNQDGLLLKNEPAITMVADNISRSAIDTLDAAIIGGKLKLPTTLEVVKSRLISMLQIKANDSIINGFGTPIVTVDGTDPRKILVNVPVIPINKVREIVITFSYVTTL